MLTIFSLCILGALSAGQAYAQTFEEGYQTYMRNKYPVAELQFKAALKKATTKEDMAFILKFIGICQYMRGDKKLAASSFFQAVNYDRGITVDESEVLDPSVVGFFDFLKNKWIKENAFAQQSQTLPAPAPPPAAAAAATAAKPAADPAASKAAPKSPSSPKAPVKPTVALKAKTKASPAAHPHPMEKTGEGGQFSFFHLTPFGGGQFYNGSYVLGSGFALLQAYGLYSFVDLQKRIDERQGLDALVQNDSRLNPEQITQFMSDNSSYIIDLKSDQTLALSLFLGAWAVSIGEAIFNAAPSPVAVEGDPKKAMQPTTPPFRWAAGWSRTGWQLHMQMDLP